jgi:hypothetical protein
MPANQRATQDADDTPVEDQQQADTDQTLGSPSSEDSPLREPVCAACGGTIRRDDIICPHCGESLVSG